LQAASVELGGGDGGVNAPRDPGVNAGVVSGAALGGLAALAAMVVAARKVRERMLVNEQLAKEMEMTLFKNGTNHQAAPPSKKPKMFVSLFKSSNNKAAERISGKNNSLVAAEDTRESAANPMYEETKDKKTVNVQGVTLRTRYSFHGVEADELNVAAGTMLHAVEKNEDWYVCQDQTTGKYGLIPASYVSSV